MKRVRAACHPDGQGQDIPFNLRDPRDLREKMPLTAGLYLATIFFYSKLAIENPTLNAYETAFTDWLYYSHYAHRIVQLR